MLRFKVVILFLFLTGLATAYFNRSTPEIQGGLYAKEIPIKIGEWLGVEREVDATTIAILETEDIISRKYILNERTMVIMNVIFSQDNRRAVHPPEVCYRGGGWEMESRKITTLDYQSPDGEKQLRIAEMEGFRPGYRLVLVYWYKCGPNYTSNFYRQQLNVAMNQILNKKSTAALVSLAMIVPEGDITESRQELLKFVSLLAPIISKYLP